jgi:hypothetical protein
VTVQQSIIYARLEPAHADLKRVLQPDIRDVRYCAARIIAR